MGAAPAGPGAHCQRHRRRCAKAGIDRQERLALAPWLLDKAVACVPGEGFLDHVGLGPRDPVVAVEADVDIPEAEMVLVQQLAHPRFRDCARALLLVAELAP